MAEGRLVLPSSTMGGRRHPSAAVRKEFMNFLIKDKCGGDAIREWNAKLPKGGLRRRMKKKSLSQSLVNLPSVDDVLTEEEQDDEEALEEERLRDEERSATWQQERPAEKDFIFKEKVTIGLYVERDGAPETRTFLEVEYLLAVPQLAWATLMSKIESALDIVKCDALRHGVEGVVIVRILSLQEGVTYIVEASDGDVLLNTILKTHKPTPEPFTPAPLFDQQVDGPVLMMGTDAGFASANSRAYQRTIEVSKAQRELNFAIDVAAERGWALQPHLLQEVEREMEQTLIRSDKGRFAAQSRSNKLKLRAEVQEARRRDADLANTVSTIAACFEHLRLRDERLAHLFRVIRDPNREMQPYFEALDALQRDIAMPSAAPMLPRDQLRSLYRSAIRWMASRALVPASATELLKAGAAGRVIKYLDRNGPLADDGPALKFAICFFVNLAVHEETELWTAVFKSGGLALALACLHHRCLALHCASRSADDAVSEESRLAKAAPPPPGYDPYRLALSDDDELEPSQSSKLAVDRVAKAPRTDETDVDCDVLELTKLHWWALSLTLALLRNPRARKKVLVHLKANRLVDVLSETALRWGRYRHVVWMSSWVAMELAKESDGWRHELREARLNRTFQVACTRHHETEDVVRDVQAVLDLIYDGSANMARERKSAKAVGSLELPELDGDASAYREYAIVGDEFRWGASSPTARWKRNIRRAIKSRHSYNEEVPEQQQQQRPKSAANFTRPQPVFFT